MASILEDPEWPGGPPRSSGVDPFDPDALRHYALIAPDDWRRWFYLAFYYDQACQSKNAIEPYSVVISLAPHIGLVHYLLGRAKSLELAYQEAELHLLDATRLRPDLVGAWVLLGAIRSSGRRFEEALQAWLNAVRIDPTGENYFQASRCLLALGRLDEATVVLEEAVRRKPNHTVARRALVYLGDVRHEPDSMHLHLQRLFEFDEDMAREVESKLAQ